MQNFSAHRLRFVTEVQTTIELNQHQGSAIRGSLFHALRYRFCGNKQAGECVTCPLVATCPVATLVSTLKPGSSRGRDVPRPYTIQPPLLGESGRATETATGHVVYKPGGTLTFGLTLYAQALQLFPYVVLSTKTFEDNGIGRRMQQGDGHWQRGTLTIQKVWAENPLTGEQQSVMAGDEQMVQIPDIPITHQQICNWGNTQITDHVSRVTLHFLTPTRIIQRKHLLKPPDFHFQPFFQRLMERLEALSRDFSDTPLRFDDPQGLIQVAGRVRVIENALSWTELHSYSTRQRRSTPISGLMGTVVLQADDWTPFLPWLVWGQFTHVGKDAVKGNGWYTLEV
ncbi:MAG: CRISPR system precrRNA processing endoribonuclease RAMP protein Cas6 [Chloroflexi bacterium]|nr:CRISPR system precrRNA processing endoribonuclease RAMP protein Cas6 [Chloroflexota bacterium]